METENEIEYGAIPTAHKADRGKACAKAIRAKGHLQPIVWIRTVIPELHFDPKESQKKRNERRKLERRIGIALLGRPSTVAWPFILRIERALGMHEFE